MNAFDKVIGYDTIKDELLQVCDMIQNRAVYEALGAKQPQGVLLYGEPGLGKTLMANCFIEESGLKAYTIRKNKGAVDFVKEISDVFRRAKETAPAIVFLDDMDKFANEDDYHRDAEEYVAVQAGIDEVKGAEVLVLATVNDMDKLPCSLTRSGRFDRRIEVNCPTDQDAKEIIAHYLKGKNVADTVNTDDLAKMVSHSSCADLETILNEAAMMAAFSRKHQIEMDDLVKAVLRKQYNAPDNYSKTSSEEQRMSALHEAGHLVACEVLCPGSVGFASLRTTGRDSKGGFIHRYKDFPDKYFDVIVSLAGKAAAELYDSGRSAPGCRSDIRRACTIIRDGLSLEASLGMGFYDVETRRSNAMSEALNIRSEAVVHAELERYLFKARDILLKNREFLESVAAALVEKETLLYSDIAALRKNVTIVDVAA